MCFPPAARLRLSIKYFFAFQLPSSSTSEKRLHPLIESMLPDERCALGYPLISRLMPRLFIAAVLRVWKADIAVVVYADGR